RPVAETHGKSLVHMMFFRRISAGSILSFAAAMSRMCSIVYCAAGRPTPRYTLDVVLFVATATASMCTFLILYGPGVAIAAWSGSKEGVQGYEVYAPTSPTNFVLMPRIVPSFLQASST